jgi:hypothetical protein
VAQGESPEFKPQCHKTKTKAATNVVEDAEEKEP